MHYLLEVLYHGVRVFRQSEWKRIKVKNFKPSKRKFAHLKVITVNDTEYVLPNDAAHVIGCDSRTMKRYLEKGLIKGDKELFGREAQRWLVQYNSFKKYVEDLLKEYEK